MNQRNLKMSNDNNKKQKDNAATLTGKTTSPSSKQMESRLEGMMKRVKTYPMYPELMQLLQKHDVTLKFDAQLDPDTAATYSPYHKTILLSWFVNDETLISEFIPHETRHAWQHQNGLMDEDEADPEKSYILNRFCEADAHAFAARFKLDLLCYLDKNEPEEYEHYLNAIDVTEIDTHYIDQFEINKDPVQATQAAFLAFFNTQDICQSYDALITEKLESITSLCSALDTLLTENDIDKNDKTTLRLFLDQAYPDAPAFLVNAWMHYQDPTTAKNNTIPLTHTQLEKFGQFDLHQTTTDNYLKNIAVPLLSTQFTGHLPVHINTAEPVKNKPKPPKL